MLENQKEHLQGIRKDFEISYRFFTPDEGGRKTLPSQIYRSDWLYEGDDITTTGIYIVWPIFLNKTGDIIDIGEVVPNEGSAHMHIVDDDFRNSIHAKRINVGVRGYFMEGPNRVAEATVTKLLSILEI